MTSKVLLAFILAFLIIGAIYLTKDTTTQPLPSSSPNTTSVPQTTPVPLGTPVISNSQNVKVTNPRPNQTISSPFTLEGEARVFENVFTYRVTDANGNKLAEGHGTANAPDVGQYGPFQVQVSFTKPNTSTGFVEVFSNSAKDGSEIDMVKILVQFSQ